MSTADGAVVGTTRILDHGPAADRWNLVILPDGYQSEQLAQFATDAQNLVTTLLATAPFDRLQDAINVFRVDVSSTDAGADDPCATPATTARTYFDATFCYGGVQRLLVVNPTTALSVASTAVPEVDMVMVMVNSTTYGGSGGSVAVFSRAPSAEEIALHEMGHTGFRLADEYESYAGCGSGEVGHDHHDAVEPVEPNVTIDANRATNKWRDLVAPATPMPTTRNADCTRCDPQPNPLAAGTIGAFEGAHFSHCGAYRPAFDCRMRQLGFPFCEVCQRAIERRLAPYTPARNEAAVQMVDPQLAPEYLSALARSDFVGAMNAVFATPHWAGTVDFPLDSAQPVNQAALADVKRRVLNSFPSPAIALTSYFSLAGDVSAGSDAVREGRRSAIAIAAQTETMGGGGSSAIGCFQVGQDALDVARAHGVNQRAIAVAQLWFSTVGVAIFVVDRPLRAQYSAHLAQGNFTAMMQTVVQVPHLLARVGFEGESGQTFPRDVIDIVRDRFRAMFPSEQLISFPHHFSRIGDVRAGTPTARDARRQAIELATTTAPGAGGSAPGAGVYEIPPDAFEVASAAGAVGMNVIVVVSPALLSEWLPDLVVVQP